MNDNANARPPAPPEEQPVQPVASEQPYAGGPAYAYQPPTAPPAPGSGKALAALICGICAIVFAGTVVVGIALGVVAIVLAAQYVKAFGADGKATGGKVCGIVGIALSAVMLVLYLTLGTFVVQAAFEYADDAMGRRAVPVPEVVPQPAPETRVPDASKPDAAPTADVQAAKQAVAAELDKVESPDQATLAVIAREADKEFADDLGFSLTEVGIDATEFATWLVEGVDCTIADSDVRLRADGEGEVLVVAQAKSFKELAWSLESQTSAYVNPQRLDHNANAAPLDDPAKSALADLVRAAMDSAAAVPTTFSVDVMEVGGSWTVERDELDSIIDDLFDL